MTKRVQVYLDEENFQYLEDRSQKERRKPGNLAALWITERIEAEKAKAKEDNSQNEA